jgi:hypothetical protein
MGVWYILITFQHPTSFFLQGERAMKLQKCALMEESPYFKVENSNFFLG